MKFFESLPPRSARVERLQAALQAADTSGTGKEVLDMFSEPGFANSSFMLRRGMMIRKLLSSLPVKIYEDELIFGSYMGAYPRVIAETYEERKQWARLSVAFPGRNTIYGSNDYCYENRELTEVELHNEERGRWNWGHSCYGLEKLLHKGYAAMINDAQQQIDQMESSGERDTDKTEFWHSVIMSCQAVIDLSNRYADELETRAKQETNPLRAIELEEAAVRMRHVPAYPARTFHEALQSTWFSYMCNLLFNGTDMGRFDQILFPYYAADLEKGRITIATAQELLECLWIKFNEWARWHPNGRGFHPSIMLAGMNSDGVDATNALTYMCMHATRNLIVPTPKLSLRINAMTPDDLFEMAHAMLLEGLMMPDFYNESTILKAYEKIGIPFEDAITFAQSVCEELSLAGISEDCTNEGPHIDLHDLVMRAMYGADEHTSFAGLLEKVDAEIAQKVASEVDYHNLQTRLLAHYLPEPLHSATIEGCIESGRDITNGGAKYNNTGSVLSGIATAANSLYAVKKLVYDEKRMTIRELLDVLADDYTTQPALRDEILSKFPKYGNDVDEVDQYAVRLFDVFCHELGKYRNNRGGVFKIGAWASEFRSNYPATPDGRKRWDSFATNISPTPGTDQKGATAVIRSATKLALDRCTAGGMVDVTMSPSSLRGSKGVEILRFLVTTYCNLGGCGIQFNFVDSTTLESAMEDPLKYKNLMVRVWGYNDYFVSLDKGMQRHILDRTRNEER